MLSILFLIVAAVPAMATDTRQISLGYVGNYIEDDYNIFTWYATLPSYTNTVWLGLEYELYYYETEDFGPSGSYSYMGASYGLGKEAKYGTLAMFYYNYGAPLNTFGGEAFTETPNTKWSVLYAYPMDKISLGFYFNRADRSQKNEDEDGTVYEHAVGYTTLGAGIRFDLGEKAYADLALDYNMGSYKDDNYSYSAYGEVTEDANTMLGIRGRMFYEWNETITLVPYVSYRFFDFSYKADSAEAWKDEYWGVKGSNITLGIGANVKVNEDNLLIFAVEPYDYYKYEPSDPAAGVDIEYTYTYLPTMYLALESDVKDWLTFRAGAQKYFYKTKQDYTEDEDESKYTYTDSGYNFTMGLGFHIGDFDIDAYINNNLPFRLGYWLTGYQEYYNEYDAPVYQLTALYHF